MLERIRKSREQAIQENKIIYLRREDLTKQPKAMVDIGGGSGKLGYSWYQTGTRIGIEIPYILKEKSQLVTDIQPQHLSISFPLASGGNFNLELELFDKIIPEGSKALVNLKYIDIQLEKADKSKNWPQLKTDVKQSVEVTEVAKASYPTSSLKKKDWDKVERDIGIEISKNKEEYGEDPVNALFK